MISSVVFFQCCQTFCFHFLQYFFIFHHIKQTEQPAVIKLYHLLLLCHRYVCCCLRSLIAYRKLGNIHTSAPDSHAQLQSGHTSFSSFYGTLYKAAQILFRKRIRYQHKIRVVIKKASIVSDILQIYLYSIRQLFSLHCVHRVQPLTSHQQHLKASIYIKIL